MVQRLGFPRYFHGKGQCPVFTQDKYGYLRRLPKSMVNPTAAVRLSPFHTIADYEKQISPLFSTTLHSTSGWVVKFPFVTHSEGFGSFSKKEEVFNKLVLASQKFEGRIPYALIQPRLTNRMEYMVRY